MPVYVEILGIEPEDLQMNQRTGENAHDHIALANCIYGSIKNQELGPGRQYYDVDELAGYLDYLSENITGVATVMNGDMHEKITGHRPEYADEEAD